MALVMENIAVRDEGKDILAGINLKMEEGTLHGLLSTAGRERTTLLRVLAGLVKSEYIRVESKEKEYSCCIPRVY